MLARDKSPLKRTPLHALHVARGGKLVAFAGYEMPVQYPAGVLKEHLHTRSAAGLFDVSHMGQLALRPKSGQVADAALALQGPKAESVLAKFCADVSAMRFMDTGPRKVAGFDCFVSRSGYTGEDGFEISVPA